MAAVETLSIALNSEVLADVRLAIANGEYASTSEVIRDALQTWKHSRQAREIALESLRGLWREGVDSGEGQPLDAEDIKCRGRERLAANKAARR